MYKQLFILILLLVSLSGNAQWSWQYTNTQQAPANANFTILDQAVDSANNLYLVYSVDPGKQLYFSKVNAIGQTLWTNTLGVPSFSLVDVTRGRIHVNNNKAYVYYVGQGSSVAAVAAQYDTAGNFINYLNTSQINSIWVYDVFGLQALPGGALLSYYSYGNALTNNDTVYVRKFSNNGNLAWQLKYPVLRTGAFSPCYYNNNGQFYFTYTNDSLAGGVHYLTTFTRCIDTNGTVLWTNQQPGLVGRFIKPLNNSTDMIVCGPTNPNGGLNGNNVGDIVLSRINGVNGQTVWTQTYNGSDSKRDEVYGLVIDPMNSIYVAGAENIQAVVAAYNRSILLQYNAAGQLGYAKKGPITSTINGLFINPLQELLTLEILNGQVKLGKYQAVSGLGIDSLTYPVTYAIGKADAVCSHTADVFFTYSEGHCGANHVEAMRFCSRAVCNPNALNEQDLVSSPLFFPNPSNGNLRFSEKTMPTHIDVRSLDGRRIPIEQDGLTLRLPCYAQGYFILLYDYAGQWHQQSIVVR